MMPPVLAFITMPLAPLAAENLSVMASSPFSR